MSDEEKIFKTSNGTASVREAKSRRAVQEMYRQLLFITVIATLLAIFLLLGAFWESVFTRNHDPSAPSVLIVVIAAGVLGALFSHLTRLYRYEDLPTVLARSDMPYLGGVHFTLYSMIPLLVGAIAACVLYLAFAGSILQGPLFPVFGCANAKSCVTFREVVDSWSPSSAEDFVKAILWGFISGFAERLVPDTLGKLASKVNVTDG